jgi:hypothetical protein
MKSRVEPQPRAVQAAAGEPVRGHSTPDPESPQPDPAPTQAPDEYPAPSHAPVQEPRLPEPPIKA